MNVVAFAPYAISATWFNLDLEMIQQHLDAGDEVALVGCNSSLTACDFNPTHDAYQCLCCIGRRMHGVSLLSDRVRVRNLVRLTAAQRQEIAGLQTDFADAAELNRFQIEDFDVGWAVSASLTWLLRDADPPLDEHRGLLRDLLASAMSVYRSMQNYLEQHSVDRVYLFNGKHAVQRAALRACQSKEVDCYVTERGHDADSYELFPNVLPHDLEYRVEQIRLSWEDAREEAERPAIAAKFYEERAARIAQDWFAFASQQESDRLPDNWDPTKRNIAIYTSSEDEFGGIGTQWLGPLYEHQLEGLRRIAADLEHCADVHLYLRIHPNAEGLQNSREAGIRDLRSSNLTIIPAEADIDSYALMRGSDKVLTFGSTMGIEAVYWGVPSVLAGRSLYRDLGGTYTPATHEDLIELLLSDLEPQDRAGALAYGYYNKTFGTPLTYVRADDPQTASFKGEYIVPNRWLGHVANRIRRLPKVNRLVSSVSRSLAAKRITGSFKSAGITAAPPPSTDLGSGVLPS